MMIGGVMRTSVSRKRCSVTNNIRAVRGQNVRAGNVCVGWARVVDEGGRGGPTPVARRRRGGSADTRRATGRPAVTTSQERDRWPRTAA